MADSGREQTFADSANLVSLTDLQSNIQYANQDFIDISGYSESELVGQTHNLVRHPDMPKAAFADLWATIKADKPWRGMVKNRCKNGDYYWVDAYVTPVYEHGRKIGYQSVRSHPSRQQVREAETLYAKMRANPAMTMPKPLRWRDLSINIRISVLMSTISLLVVLNSASNALGLSHSVEYLFSGIAVAACLATWFLVNRNIVAPVKSLVESVKLVAGGSLVIPINARAKDEVGEVYMSVKLLQARLRTVIGRFDESVNTLSGLVEQTSLASDKTLRGMNQQALETEQVATAMDEMSATVAEVARNVNSASEAAGNAYSDATHGSEIVAQAHAQIEALAKGVENSSAAVNSLAEESERIRQITESISAIAEQTNLLALNAAIEAARAGESGRGFAVVADEVRNLAKSTQEATQEIRSTTDNIHLGISNAINVMEQSVLGAKNAVEKNRETEENFRDISNHIALINDMSIQIATAAEEQTAVAEEMNRNVRHISDASSQTQGDAILLQKSSLEQIQMMDKLAKQVDLFDMGKAAVAFDFDNAKQAHLAWKTRVRAYLNGDNSVLTKEQACSHRDCVLGKWYYSEGIKNYKHLAPFKAIEKPHEQLHSVIKEIVHAKEQGKANMAEELYQQIEPLSQQIVQHLEQTKTAI